MADGGGIGGQAPAGGRMNEELRAALDSLFSLRQFGMKPGLETMAALAARLGNPERGLRFLHIAGTNGKGSTAAMLDSILRAAGFKTGLFTSPHLAWFGERIRINGRPLPPEEVLKVYHTVRPHMDALAADPAHRQPTFFEAATAMALVAFREARVDWVVWETGMGGRLDATNIVTPAVSVITAIDRDHMAWLGDTLAEIAGEKAGILKPGVPAVAAAQAAEARAALGRRAAEIGSPLEFAEPGEVAACEESLEGQRIRWRGAGFHLALAGRHQLGNAAVVLRTVEALRRGGFAIPEAAVAKGLAEVVWPGRFQLVRRNPPAVVDGAHNPAGAAALADAWRRLLPGRRAWVIFGMLRDKEIGEVVREIAGVAARVTLVPVASSRTAEGGELRAAWAAAAPGVLVGEAAGFREAWAEASGGGDAVLVAGSLFLAGEALADLLPGDWWSPGAQRHCSRGCG